MEEKEVKPEVEEKEQTKAENEMSPTTVKVLTAIGYFGFLFLIPLLVVPKDNKFTRFHVNQALVLFIADIVLGVVSGILGLIPYVGVIIGSICGLLVLVVMIIQIVAVANGEEKEIPLIGKIRLIK
mgnify:CR=1 FL=1